MVRKGRFSLNSSRISVANDSMSAEQAEPPQEFSEFIKGFYTPNLVEEEFLGYHETSRLIKKSLDVLSTPGRQILDHVLITGPSGTGKTTLVRQLAKQHQNITLYYLKSSWMMRKKFGNLESRLENLFEEATLKGPSVIFIDNIDLVVTSRSELKDRLFNLLDDLLEGLRSNFARVLVLVAAENTDILSSRLKETFFGEEIKFSLPTSSDRCEILKRLLKDKDEMTHHCLDQIVGSTQCYSYKDLRKACNIAIEGDTSTSLIDRLKSAIATTKPTRVKSITTPCPPLHWSDIGGVEDAKRELQESVIWPIMRQAEFKEIGISANKGVLLYGPPGCSKTMLAQALATESGYNFISVKGPALVSKYVGDSEAEVRKLYERASIIAPCIIFLDEVDGFLPERSEKQSSSVGDRVVTQLLTELNDQGNNVFTIAATNRPEKVDCALMRPGRLDPAIYIPLPSLRDRQKIFEVHMRQLRLNLDDPLEKVIECLAIKTDGFSGAEIAGVCRKAGIVALRENLRQIELRHIEAVLKVVKPRTSLDLLEGYKKFQSNNSNLTYVEDQLIEPFSNLSSGGRE